MFISLDGFTCCWDHLIQNVKKKFEEKALLALTTLTSKAVC